MPRSTFLFTMRLPACLSGILGIVTATIGCRAQTITIYRDSYGVPSIVADRPADAAYGLGYAMTQDDAERMALNFKLARGRLAEAEGRRQLFADGFLRSLGIEEMAEEKARTLSGDQAEWITSFCAGANKSLSEQKGRLPDWIEPFTPVDVLAMAQMLNAAFPLQDVANQLMPGIGSNQFAVAPKRSATGHALVSMDPHLDWTGPVVWYEFAMYAPGITFHGVTVPGIPYGVMGHSDKVAWAMTNNNPSLFAFYTVKTNPDNPKQYSYHGTWKDFETVRMTLKYRENGQLKETTQTVLRTAWGPMIPFHSEALRFSMLGAWEILDEAPRMMRAQNARQFRDALRPLGLSMWNFVYGDTQGHIGYQYNARVPDRDPSFDWTKPVPGSDPRTKWGPLWPLDRLPHVEDPKTGLLVNCNSAPWLTPLDDEIKNTGWPAYVTTYDHTTRYDRLSSLLLPDHRVTIENAKRYATDTLVPYAPAAVKALQAAAARTAGGAQDAEVAPALKVLSAWNDRCDGDATGCALYYDWFTADKQMPALAQKAAAGTPWSGTESDAALTALKKAAETLRRQQSRLDIPWGLMHFSMRGDKTVPVSGFQVAAGGKAISAVVPNSGPLKDGKMDCTFGSSFRMIVSLDPKHVQSWSILPYGNSQDPKNPHFADQMTLFGRGEYKDTLFGLARIRKQAGSTQTLHRE